MIPQGFSHVKIVEERRKSLLFLLPCNLHAFLYNKEITNSSEKKRGNRKSKSFGSLQFFFLFFLRLPRNDQSENDMKIGT